jgi:hypothetical protein
MEQSSARTRSASSGHNDAFSKSLQATKSAGSKESDLPSSLKQFSKTDFRLPERASARSLTLTAAANAPAPSTHN